MIASGKPRYQRFYRFNAPMHVRQHFVHAHVEKSLKTKLKLSKRAVQIAKGDTVKLMTGAKRGTTGKVTSVNLKTGKITIDSVMRKNSRGKEHGVPISPSNVYIIDLNLSDRVRAAKLKVAAQAVKKEEKREAAMAAPAAAPQAQVNK